MQTPGSNGVRTRRILIRHLALQSEIHVSSYSDLPLCSRNINIASDQGLAVGIATLLVYAAAALASNASTIWSLLVACLLLCSVALLALCNSFTHCLQMYDWIVQEGKTPRKEVGNGQSTR